MLEPEIFAQGELDMEVVYEDGEWELALLDEANERELEPDQALHYGVAATRQVFPQMHPMGSWGMQETRYGFCHRKSKRVFFTPVLRVMRLSQECSSRKQ